MTGDAVPVTLWDCSHCHDTHMVTREDRQFMCTRCPTPCRKCQAGPSPYCRKTPCPCACHPKNRQATGAPVATAKDTRAELAEAFDAHGVMDTTDSRDRMLDAVDARIRELARKELAGGAKGWVPTPQLDRPRPPEHAQAPDFYADPRVVEMRRLLDIHATCGLVGCSERGCHSCWEISSLGGEPYSGEGHLASCSLGTLLASLPPYSPTPHAGEVVAVDAQAFLTGERWGVFDKHGRPMPTGDGSPYEGTEDGCKTAASILSNYDGQFIAKPLAATRAVVARVRKAKPGPGHFRCGVCRDVVSNDEGSDDAFPGACGSCWHALTACVDEVERLSALGIDVGAREYRRGSQDTFAIVLGRLRLIGQEDGPENERPQGAKEGGDDGEKEDREAGTPEATQEGAGSPAGSALPGVQRQEPQGRQPGVPGVLQPLAPRPWDWRRVRAERPTYQCNGCGQPARKWTSERCYFPRGGDRAVHTLPPEPASEACSDDRCERNGGTHPHPTEQAAEVGAEGSLLDGPRGIEWLRRAIDREDFSGLKAGGVRKLLTYIDQQRNDAALSRGRIVKALGCESTRILLEALHAEDGETALEAAVRHAAELSAVRFEVEAERINSAGAREADRTRIADLERELALTHKKLADMVPRSRIAAVDAEWAERAAEELEEA